MAWLYSVMSLIETEWKVFPMLHPPSCPSQSRFHNALPRETVQCSVTVVEKRENEGSNYQVNNIKLGLSTIGSRKCPAITMLSGKTAMKSLICQK